MEKNLNILTKGTIQFKWLNLGKGLSIISSIPAALWVVEGTIKFKWLNLGKGLSIISTLWIVEGPDTLRTMREDQ